MLLSDLPTCKKVAICRSSRTSGSTLFPGLGIARAACAATSCNAGSFSSSFWSSSAVNLSGHFSGKKRFKTSALQPFHFSMHFWLDTSLQLRDACPNRAAKVMCCKRAPRSSTCCSKCCRRRARRGRISKSCTWRVPALKNITFHTFHGFQLNL